MRYMNEIRRLNSNSLNDMREEINVPAKANRSDNEGFSR